MDIRELQKEVHELAVAKGWWEDRDVDDPSAVAGAIALIHSEVSEAFSEKLAGNFATYYGPDGKPEGFAIELADAAIRTLDLCCAIADPENEPNELIWEMSDYSVDTCLMLIHRDLSNALEMVRVNNTDGVIRNLHTALNTIVSTANRACVDLHGAMALKHEFNKTRPRRHGGKRL